MRPPPATLNKRDRRTLARLAAGKTLYHTIPEKRLNKLMKLGWLPLKPTPKESTVFPSVPLDFRYNHTGKIVKARTTDLLRDVGSVQFFFKCECGDVGGMRNTRREARHDHGIHVGYLYAKHKSNKDFERLRATGQLRSFKDEYEVLAARCQKQEADLAYYVRTLSETRAQLFEAKNLTNETLINYAKETMRKLDPVTVKQIYLASKQVLMDMPPPLNEKGE